MTPPSPKPLPRAHPDELHNTFSHVIAEATKRFDDAPLIGLLQSISNQSAAVCETLANVVKTLRRPPVPLPSTSRLASPPPPSSAPSQTGAETQTFALTAVDVDLAEAAQPLAAAATAVDATTLPLKPRRITDLAFPGPSGSAPCYFRMIINPLHPSQPKTPNPTLLDACPPPPSSSSHPSRPPPPPSPPPPPPLHLRGCSCISRPIARYRRDER